MSNRTMVAWENATEMVPQRNEDDDKEEKDINMNDDDFFEKKKRRKTCLISTVLWMTRIIPFLLAIAGIIMIIVLTSNPSNWRTDNESNDIEVIQRQSNRATLNAILIAILLNIVGAFMFYIKVREALVVNNYGLFFGRVVQYMLDQGIARDAGLAIFFTSAGYAYTFAAVISGNFMRYIVTVFLDLFIASPVQDVVKMQLLKTGVLRRLKDESGKHEYILKYDQFLADKLPTILLSIVALICNSYTNRIRWTWAYPPESLDRELRIAPGIIVLSTAVAGALYLVFYVIMDNLSEREYFDINRKLVYVLAVFMILFGLNSTDDIEAPVEGESDIEYTKSLGAGKPFLGLLVFACLSVYGFVYPVWTRLGCCGYCKPTPRELEETDHIMDADWDDDGYVTRQEMREGMRREIETILRQRQNNV